MMKGRDEKGKVSNIKGPGKNCFSLLKFLHDHGGGGWVGEINRTAAVTAHSRGLTPLLNGPFETGNKAPSGVKLLILIDVLGVSHDG